MCVQQQNESQNREQCTIRKYCPLLHPQDGKEIKVNVRGICHISICITTTIVKPTPFYPGSVSIAWLNSHQKMLLLDKVRSHLILPPNPPKRGEGGFKPRLVLPSTKLAELSKSNVYWRSLKQQIRVCISHQIQRSLVLHAILVLQHCICSLLLHTCLHQVNQSFHVTTPSTCHNK